MLHKSWPWEDHHLIGAMKANLDYLTLNITTEFAYQEVGHLRQDAVIRMYLYQQIEELVYPYNHTMAEFMIRISELRNQLAMCDVKDEGIIVPPELGVENRTCSNVLSADPNRSHTPEHLPRY
ncbi:hypothetical protein HHK36_020048 [Tetracentron sinense]|uniref:Uncharacterized protein n=1 Tax=Tetracentron sinense TaxID=13715 RepID=A0A834YUE2_TETSI|nr:hypothetical protein HHK36_020048 [Tetracentron sinense]